MSLGQRLKERGQQLAFDYAGERFKQEVMPALREWLAVRKKFGHREFRFEQFREFCEKFGLAPASPNALGAIPQSAIKEGLIKPTGRYEKAVSAKTHRHPVAIYEII